MKTLPSLTATMKLMSQCGQVRASLMPRPHPLIRKRVWWLWSDFLRSSAKSAVLIKHWLHPCMTEPILLVYVNTWMTWHCYIGLSKI